MRFHETVDYDLICTYTAYYQQYTDKISIKSNEGMRA